MTRARFVLSMNDNSNINPVLRDRIQLVKMDTPKVEDKVEIAQGFLLPASLRNVGILAENLHIPRDNLHHAISTGTAEAGVRQLKYCLESIVRRSLTPGGKSNIAVD
jgi:ATP-dependent Lon protease